MTDQATTGLDEVKAQMDERRIARGVALGLPLVSVTLATIVGVIFGPSLAILVLVAGALLGGIALFWASLRVLTGDAALAPEVEALDRSGYGVDALGSRRKMLVLALKDLENEHALGKLDAEDYQQVSDTYRVELKAVMKQIDAALEPFRGKAEDVARSFLSKRGLAESGYRGELPPSTKKSKKGASLAEAKGEPEPTKRLVCPSCDASNEPDAKFCKECATTLTKPRSNFPSDEYEENEETSDEA